MCFKFLTFFGTAIENYYLNLNSKLFKMKKLFFVAVGLVSMIVVNAQDKTETPQLGIKTSANVTSFVGDDVNDKDYKLGWSAGLYYHIPVNQTLAIQPEVNYARVGAKYKNEMINSQNISQTYSNTTTLDYIQVPVLLKIYPGGTRFNFEVGPQVGFNVYASNKAKFDTNIAGENIVSETKTDISDNVEKVDYGVVGGVGYNVTDNVNVGARYYLGLQDTFKSNSNFDAKNHGFTFGVGYSF